MADQKYHQDYLHENFNVSLPSENAHWRPLNSRLFVYLLNYGKHISINFLWMENDISKVTYPIIRGNALTLSIVKSD